MNVYREKTDLALLDGKVITVDPEDTVAEAVAIKGNRILKVGSSEEIREMFDDDTEKIDLAGRVVLPGFVDAHTHAESYCLNQKYRLKVHVPPLRSVKEVLKMVREKADEIPKGEWIVCRGSFHLDHKYEEGRYPTKAELDDAAPDHPVVMFSGSHIGIANSMALEKSGITKETPRLVELPGHVALVEKDPETGEPTGIVREGSRLLRIPKFGKEELEKALEEVLTSDFVRQGVTSIHDMSSVETFRIFQSWTEKRKTPLRILFYFFMPSYGGDVDPLVKFGFQTGFGNEWLKLGGVKLMIDGGITGPKASLYQPYPHDAHDFGLLNYSQEKLTEIYVKAHQAGLQVISHTTGEKSQDMVMNSIQAAIYETPREDHRHRLEHAGNYFATAERMERMLGLGAIPVVNPQFLHAFGFLMEHFYGHRIRQGLFPYRMLLDMGFKLPFSSDSTGTQPEASNPWWGIWCAVKRESFDGSTLDPDQRISVMEAIRCYTMYAAYSGFEEEVKGSLEPGKLADLIVVSEDPLTVPVDQIKDIKTIMTIIDGEIVYKSSAWQ